jgi:flagellar assembly protein FliH
MSWTDQIFAEDFDRPKVPEPPPNPEPVAPVYTAEELQAARAEALREGHEAGLAEADGITASLARHALLTIADSLQTARDDVRGIAEEAAESLACLLMDAFATAFPALCARHAETELRAIVRAVVPHLHTEPTITIRASPHVTEALAEEIAALDPEALDRVRIVPTDSVPQGDIRIAWRSGKAHRDTTKLWADIENVLAPAGLLNAERQTAKEPENVD